jgi:hypothetical protein
MSHSSPTLAIEIKSVKRTRKRIEIAWCQGESAFDLAERDNPLPGFTRSIDALAPVVRDICHLRADWLEDSVKVVGFSLGEQSGARTVSIYAHAQVPDADKPFVIRTPERMMELPATEGSYSPPLSAILLRAVEEAIEEAKAYVRGYRAQGEIVFEDDDGDEDGEDGDGDNDDTAPLPFTVRVVTHDAVAMTAESADADHTEVHAVVQAPATARGRGRPKGAKNKPKAPAAPALPLGENTPAAPAP